ncbi:L-asparaginase, partial [Chroococcidiopsidales cyanobacterium LEGE 13417]|nr:L-asparaginase [Chroococcidiopsidales cyanobacterium LEGE 13417]
MTQVSAAPVEVRPSSPAAPSTAAQRQLPNVVIIATGGTIAGTGATSTTTVGYTAAKVGIDSLLNAVPEIK